MSVAVLNTWTVCMAFQSVASFVAAPGRERVDVLGPCPDGVSDNSFEKVGL